MVVDTISLEFADRLRIRGISDAHVGAAAQEEKRLKRDIDSVLAEEDSYVILLGDQIEAITLKDVRFRAGSVKRDMLDDLDSLLNAQLREAIRTFKPLADEGRILGALLGNHELKCEEVGGIDIHRMFCEGLGIRDLGYSCLLRLTIGKHSHNTRKNLVIYAHHGHGGTGKKSGASINSMEDLAADWDADIFFMGHNHKRHTSKATSFAVTGSGTPRLLEKERAFVRTGSYYKTYREGRRPDYGEKTGYRPANIGSPPYVDVTIEGKHHELRMKVTE